MDTKWSALLFVGLLSLQVYAQPRPPAPPRPATQPDHPVARQVRVLLSEGKLAEAMQYTEQQLQARPKDQAVLTIYTELRMTIARQAIAAQKFQQAERLLGQVIAADPKHASAGRMLDIIAHARTRIEPGLVDAEQLLRLERFEQAAAILAQVAGLIPDQPQRWKQPWLAAALGAGDDHYLMRSYEAALPFYSQAIELGAGQGPGGEQLMWRWSHCYAMNLGRSADVPRTAAQWAGIVEDAKERFEAARATTLGLFVSAIGRHNLSDVANAIPLYRQVLGGEAPPPGRAPPADEARALREKAVAHVDALHRGQQIGRRSGPFAVVLPGEPLERRSGRIVVRAHNDLLARRVLEAVEYHAPRLVEYLGGNKNDLDWPIDYTVVIRPKSEGELQDMFVPSFSRITSQGGKLVRHETISLQTDPLLIGATVPHELSHILISRLAGYTRIPLAIDEGLSIHAETTARYLMFRRALIQSGGPKLTIEQLLASEALPPVGQRAAFYAECYNLVAWLLTRGRPGKVIEMCKLVGKQTPVQALLTTYELADLATAEKAYRTFLQSQGLAR